MQISVNESRLGVGALVAFVVGWVLFGLLVATLLAIIILVFMGVIRVR